MEQEQRKGEPRIWERMSSAKFLALASPVGLALAYLYEAGRYTYMGVPWLLIELPIPRLIASATCLSILAIVILACFFASSHATESKSKFARYLGWLAAFFAIFGIGALLNATSIRGVAFSVLFSSFMAWLALSDDSESDSKEAKKGKERRAFDEIMGTATLLVFMAYTVHGVGFTAERLSPRRDCFPAIENAFVAGISTGQLIVKSFDPSSKRLTAGVTLVPMDERLTLTKCFVHINTWNSVSLVEVRKAP